MQYVMQWLQLLAVCKYAMAQTKAIPSWRMETISSDLACSVDAVEFLEDRNQTGCSSDEWYQPVANVGRCSKCSVQSRGPGFYCNQSKVVLCPTGFYCPSYLEKHPCPEGKWCRAGFVKPIDCSVTISCPEGSENQKAGWGFFIGMIWIVLVFVCASLAIYIHTLRAEREIARIARVAEKSHEQNLGADLEIEENARNVTVEFEGLTMHLKKNGKCVLDNVTGKFPGGSLVALMGPSGGGKTTFMNALCGRAGYGDVTGVIRINGREGGVTDIPRLVGFVPQDDIMHCDLTVQQNLHYNALLRLPAGTPYKAAVKLVTHIMEKLGLSRIANSVVGNAEQRGISGGQKKRVNIGMELAAMPSIIFMDEPTSGLDGAATLDLAMCLDNLRKSGLTIVCVIHQPRYAVFARFTHILLFGAGGGTCYCGKTDGVEPYFNGLGYRCPPKENPADWMIDIVCGLSAQESGEKLNAPGDLFRMWRTKGEQRYGSFHIGKALEQDRVTPNLLRQTWIFLTRCARQYSMLSFFISFGLLFLCGTVFGSLLTSLVDFSYRSIMEYIAGNHRILFYMICTINARKVFGYERLEYIREFSSGTSCLGYWLAKQIWNCIDWHMYTLSFSLPLYYVMPIPAQNYYKFFLAFQWAAWYHLGLGMLFSVIIVRPTTSVLACVFTPLMMELAFSGSLINIKDMNSVQRFLSAFSCGRWFRQSLFINEIRRFPEHTHNFTDVTKQFEKIQSSLDDGQVGFTWLGLLGLLFRFLTLFALLGIKYSWKKRVIDSATRVMRRLCRSRKRVLPSGDVQEVSISTTVSDVSGM